MRYNPTEYSILCKITREAYGESQSKFADRLGVSRSTVYRWENGKIKSVENVRNANRIYSRKNYLTNRKNVIFQGVFKDNITGKNVFTKARDMSGFIDMMSDIDAGIYGNFKPILKQVKQIRLLRHRI